LQSTPKVLGSAGRYAPATLCRSLSKGESNEGWRIGHAELDFGIYQPTQRSILDRKLLPEDVVLRV